MARTGWGEMGYQITTGSDDPNKVISKNRWNLPLGKGSGILGFAAQSVASASTITPSKSVVVLSGSTEVTKFLTGDSEEYDILYVFKASGASCTLTNTTGTPNADGQIVGLGSASTIALSETIPKIFIRKSNGSHQLWVEYGGSGTAAASELTGTTLASNVVTSSLTQVGTIATGTWQGTAVADSYVASAATWNAKQSALTFGISSGNVTKAGAGIADNDFIRVDGTTFEGRSASEVLSDIGGQASLTFGIADTNAVDIDDSDVADNDFAKFTSSGLEGRDYSEVKTDLSLNNVENTALSTWAGTSNITTLGTITTGTWTGTAVADEYGGTGQATYAQGDILYASATNTLTKLTKGSTGQILTMTATIPSWATASSGSDTPWTEVHNFAGYYYDMTVQTKPANPSANNARFYVKEIDSNNDGLFCIMRKNGTDTIEVQLA